MAKIEIKHSWTGEVLFEHELTDERVASGMEMRDVLEAAVKSSADLSGAYLSGADLSSAHLNGADLSRSDLSGANLSGADLSSADLSRADLSGANLSGADLSSADLNGADLSGADLSGAYLNGANLSSATWLGKPVTRVPLQLLGLCWPITILDAHMQIGCQLHSLSEWAGFDDAQIAEMDGRDALRFWRAHKATLLALAAADGRGTGVKGG